MKPSVLWKWRCGCKFDFTEQDSYATNRGCCYTELQFSWFSATSRRIFSLGAVKFWIKQLAHFLSSTSSSYLQACEMFWSVWMLISDFWSVCEHNRVWGFDPRTSGRMDGIDPRTSGRMDCDVIDSTPDESAKESSYFHVHGSQL